MENHQSIRKYLKKDVSNELIEKCLNRAIYASSSGNMQTYSIIVTRDPKIKKELEIWHFDQKPSNSAQIIVTFCADNRRHRKWIEDRGVENFNNFDNLFGFMVSAIDAILVSQNAALAFENEGLGICFLGSALASAKNISKTLKLPSGVIPVAGFALGYKNETPQKRDRLPLKYLLHYDTYHDLTNDEINDCYLKRENTGWKRMEAYSGFKEEIKKRKIKNLAQVYAYLKYLKVDYDRYSKELIDLLKQNNYL